MNAVALELNNIESCFINNEISIQQIEETPFDRTEMCEQDAE